MQVAFCEECGDRITISPEQAEKGSAPFFCSRCRPSKRSAAEGKEDCRAGNKDGLGYRCYLVQGRLKVLIVDDSRLIRRVIRQIFEGNSRLEVVGEAVNGAEALEMIPKLKPDVVTLDINMPVMDGLTTLKHIMIRFPVPTVMLSTLTREGATETFDALRYGAVDFMLKPSQFSGNGIQEQQAAIIERVSMAAGVEMARMRFLPTRPDPKKGKTLRASSCERVFAIGAAEGGYGSLLRLIPRLRADVPAAFVAVLHAPGEHVDAFAEYLDEHSSIQVCRGRNGDRIKPGTCYLNSGTDYVTIEGDGFAPCLRVTPSPFPGRRGAIDMLLISVADAFEQRSGGIILTGAGKDGVEGISEVVRRGGPVLVQEPRTCLFKEMPNAAIVTGKYNRILSDFDMANEIHRFF